MITLKPLDSADRDSFIKDNQEAFNYGALEAFGRRDDHFEEESEIISRETIEESIDGGEAYRILLDGEKVGGAVIRVDGTHGDLELLFISPKATARASDMPRGARSNGCIPGWRSGKRSRPILRSGTSISMSTAAASTSSSSTTRIIPIPTIRMRPNGSTSSSRRACSGLKNGCDSDTRRSKEHCAAAKNAV